MFRVLLNSFATMMLLASFGSAAQEQSFPLNKNPFQQPDILSYRPPIEPIAVPEPEVTEPVVREPPEIELKAVIVSQNQPMVQINESFLKIGDKNEDMRLIGITENNALFRFDGKEYTYTISDEPIGEGR